MEVQYQKDDDDDEQFVMVERVSDSFRVSWLDEDEWPDAQLGDELLFPPSPVLQGERASKYQMLMAKPVMIICLRCQP